VGTFAPSSMVEIPASGVAMQSGPSIVFLRGSSRVLQSAAKNNGNDAFLMFASIVVGLICLCYAYCMYQVVRFWCCRQSRETDEPVTQGYAFNLNTKQRRAVLEAIFSETSKSVTASSLFHKKSNDADLADIPVTLTLESKEDGQETDEDEGHVTSKTPTSSTHSSLTPEASTSIVMVEDSIGENNALAPNLEPSGTPEDGNTGISNSIAGLDTIRRSFPWNDKKNSEDSCDVLAFPVLTDEDCKEEDAIDLCLNPSPLHARKNDAQGSMDFDDEDDANENVCPICLSGYQEGDVMVSSKYCLHLFHKDCLLEWLEKHDMCPCCRVDMVTDGDVNKAATSIVGKTRMFKAVQSINVVSVLTPPVSPTHRQSPRVRRMGGSHR